MVLSSNILDQTPEVIAKWPKANYNTPDQLTWLPIYSCIWFGAATIMVAMRFWLRVRGHAGRLGLDDCVLLPAWIAALMFTAVSVVFTERANGGRHVWDVKPELRSYAVLCMWLAQFSFLICSGCTKVSILFFYRRLVTGTAKKWVYCVWFAIVFTIVYTIAFCIMLLVDCRPTRAYWMAFDIKYALTADYTCLKDSNVINTTAGVCAAISDLYAVALPCIITWHHSVPRRQRIALNAIFCLGFVVVGASGVRTYWLIMTSNSQDVIRSAFMLFVWAQFELQVGIMCASAPALRVFFRRYLGGSQASNSDSKVNTRKKSITVIGDVAIVSGPAGGGAAVSSLQKKEFHELQDLGTPGSEDGADSLSRSSWTRERDLTRYSHEEDVVQFK
ncbi:hypothetical protein Q7P36_008716 [Cladosporium allicinum]